MLRAWAKLFGLLAKAIFSSIEFRTGIIRSNHAIQISTPRTEGAELLPSLSRKAATGRTARRLTALPTRPFFKCLGLLHDTYDLRTQLWFSHGLKRQEVRRVLLDFTQAIIVNLLRKAKSVPIAQCIAGIYHIGYITFALVVLRRQDAARAIARLPSSGHSDRVRPRRCNTHRRFDQP